MRALSSKSLLLCGLCLPLIASGCKGEATPTKAPQAQDTPQVQTNNGDDPTSEPAVQAVKTEFRSFKNWTAVCNNLKTCSAYATTSDKDGYVLIQREAGPASAPVLYAAAWNLNEGRGDFSLSIHEQTFSGTNRQEAGTNPLLVFERPSTALLQALGQGREARISAGGASVLVNLEGAAQALLWMDQIQGRLDTPTALIQRGERPLNQVPPAPSEPKAPVAAPAIAQTRLPPADPLPASVLALPLVKTCREESPPSASVARLGQDRLLWEIGCGSGAYNRDTIYVLSRNDGSDAQQVQFQWSDDITPVVTNAGYDPKTRELASFGKARGLGDCGVEAVWRWTGTSFALVRENLMEECAGIVPELWPSFWSTQ